MLHKYKMLPLVAVMLVMSLVFSGTGRACGSRLRPAGSVRR